MELDKPCMKNDLILILGIKKNTNVGLGKKKTILGMSDGGCLAV